jgi:Ca2+-binding RTX toxin-like protein
MHRQTRNTSKAARLLKAIAITIGLAAAAPLPAHAAYPPRPLNHVIVEGGGGRDSSYLYVHGTHGHNNLYVDADVSNGSTIIVRSLTGERVEAGNGCSWDGRRQAAVCRRFTGIRVFLWGADDQVYVTYRLRGSVEIWGGQGNDTLETHANPYLYTPTLFGESGDDRLIGSPANENLWGGAGNDTIRGGGGHDSID